MKPLLIILRLKNPQLDYNQLFDTIEGLGCICINNWAYFLKTKLKTTDLYNNLRPHLQVDDTLMVLTLGREWQAHGSNGLIDWTIANL